MTINRRSKYRYLGFKKTGHLIFCPLCKQLVIAVRVGYMRWVYERCPICLIGFNTKAWNNAYRILLSKQNNEAGAEQSSRLAFMTKKSLITLL